MGEWKEYKLGNLGTIITGKTPSSKFPEEFGNDMPFVTPSDYGNYRKWANTAIRGLSIKGIEKLTTKILPEKSLLVTCIGSDMGKVVMNKVPVITNQQINSISTNDFVDPDFLYYKLLDIYDVLRMYGQSGTAVPIVNKGDFENIMLEMPGDRAEQTAIASVLSSLDDKIDLLHRQNITLEQLAETLFRQWFIEEVDERWETKKLEEIIAVKHGYAFSGDHIVTEETGNILVTPGNFKIGGGFKENKYKYYDTNEFPDEYILEKGDLIITMTDLSQEGDTLGFPAFVPKIPNKKLLHNQRIGKVIFNENIEVWRSFIYFLLTTAEYRNYILGSATGTTVRHTSPTRICNYEFIKPDKLILLKFNDYADPLFKKVVANSTQIRTLTRLRDTLLPKLMSGEVSVNHN